MGGDCCAEHAKLESVRHWGRGSVLSGVPGSDYTVLHFLCSCKFWSWCSLKNSTDSNRVTL